MQALRSVILAGCVVTDAKSGMARFRVGDGLGSG